MKIMNINSIYDLSVPLHARLVTFEDETIGTYTKRSFPKVSDPINQRISLALFQITAHLNTRDKNTAITAGNFYFKDEGELVLVLATQLKCEKPKVVLNATIKMAFCLLPHW